MKLFLFGDKQGQWYIGRSPSGRVQYTDNFAGAHFFPEEEVGDAEDCLGLGLDLYSVEVSNPVLVKNSTEREVPVQDGGTFAQWEVHPMDFVGRSDAVKPETTLQLSDGSEFGVGSTIGFFKRHGEQRTITLSAPDLQKLKSFVDSKPVSFSTVGGINLLSLMYTSGLMYMADGVLDNVLKLIRRNNIDFILEHEELFPDVFVDKIRQKGFFDCYAAHSLIHGEPALDTAGQVMGNIVVCAEEEQMALLSLYTSGIGVQFFVQEDAVDSYFIGFPVFHPTSLEIFGGSQKGYQQFMFQNLWVSLLSAAGIYTQVNGSFCVLDNSTLSFQLDRKDTNFRFVSRDEDLFQAIVDIVDKHS